MIDIPVDPQAHRVFDALAWGAAFAAGWAVSRWRLADARARFPRESGYVIALGFGAIFGAYLAGTLPSLMQGQGSLSHSVAGALGGAILGVEVYKGARGMRQSTGAIFVAPFVVGIVIGRFGCLFSGLADGTYGTTTALAWGVDLGDGVSRHPVQVYESLAMFLFLISYLYGLARRQAWALKYGFYAMAIMYGAQRFVWEFFKPYPTIAGPFNLFHLISLGLVVYGCVWIACARRQTA
jgi:prolipoprotein diacylglyceryltransferase